MAPETLIFTTSLAGPLGGDEILVQRASPAQFLDGAAVFVQIAESRGSGAAAFLTLGEAEALRDQLDSIIAAARA